MAITTYDELKAAVLDWMARTDVTATTGDFVSLAEARLNRELGPITTDATLTGTAGSRRIDISSISMVQPLALHIVVYGDEEPVNLRPDGSFPYLDDSGQPSYAAVEGTNLDFNTLLDQDYSFRLTYQARLALSDAAPTNWLLEQHPDLYLAACITWGGLYVKDNQEAAKWRVLFDDSLASVKNIEAKKRRGILGTEVAGMVTRNVVYDWNNI